MENDFGTNDIITGRGLGIGGFGYGTGTLTSLAHADGTALAAKIDCNAFSSAASLDRISDQNEENRRILQNERTNGMIADGQLQNAILNGQRDVSSADRFAAQAAASALCCCETQKLIVSENSKTRELINAQALRTAEREIDVLRGSSNTQSILNAICCGCNTNRNVSSATAL